MTFLRLMTVGLWYFVKRNRWNFLVIFALVGISGLGLYQSALDNLGADKAWWSGMWQNFGTEVIGAILTFTIFEMLINANNRQEALIRQMASSDNATALNAVNELRALGYLFDGSLANKYFLNSNLRDVNLENAKLHKAYFAGAKLGKSTFNNAELYNANLAYADLKNATLIETNLSGAILSGVNLQNAQLRDAIFDHTTVLPDSEWMLDENRHSKFWTSETDMARYTDTHHLDFWQPNWAKGDNNGDDISVSLHSHPYRTLRTKRRLRRTS